jgi:Icc protein
VSDTHLRPPGATGVGGIDPASALAEAVGAISRLEQAPDAVVMTGDLADGGHEEAYALLRELLSPLPMPVYLLVGNHDAREPLAAAFPDHARFAAGAPGGSLQYEADIGPLRMLVLDTLAPGHDWGELCDERLDWLEDRLARCAGRPVVVAMHHPPFATLVEPMDRIGLRRGGERLDAILRAHPNIERVICGHLHRAIDARFGGTIASTCPSTVHQMHIDFDPASPYRWTREPPQFRLHAWTPSSGLVTHLAAATPFDGPHRFRR